ncbi:hypothetical protein Tco_1008276 [Tanacetum coccineum]
MQQHQRRLQEAQERAELLGRANGESSHVLRIFDEEAQAMQSARNSSRMLEEATATGATILAKYSEQRERLKVWDTRQQSCCNTFQVYEEYITDMTFEPESMKLLGTR